MQRHPRVRGNGDQRASPSKESTRPRESCEAHPEAHVAQSRHPTLALPTDDGASIYEACKRILSLIPVKPDSMARISVSTSNLVDEKGVPIPLLPEDQTRRRLNRVIDVIQSRFGTSAIQVAAAALPRKLPEHVGGFAETGSFDFSSD